MQVKGGRYAVPIGIFSPEWLLAFGMCFIFNLHFLEGKKRRHKETELNQSIITVQSLSHELYEPVSSLVKIYMHKDWQPLSRMHH